MKLQAKESCSLWVNKFSSKDLSKIIERSTPPKFNITPGKRWLEDDFPIGKVTFQDVELRGCIEPSLGFE